MRSVWKFSEVPEDSIHQMEREAGISRLLAMVLWLRGVKSAADADRFLAPKLKDVGDPFLLPDMGLAVERLMQAGQGGRRIVVFGDYDVDGVTATAMLLLIFRHLGWRVETYLPNRRDEGYGLSLDAVTNCLEQLKPELLLAVDCGSSSFDSIERLRAGGVEVVVLDHHQLGEPLPRASALVNPQRMEPGSPQRDLCSAGLAFKLAHALTKRGREAGLQKFHEFDVRTLLDFAALGTVADLVPLTGENRILVHAGLDRMTRNARPGVRALKEVAGLKGAVGVSEVAFQLGPRLNAAGRLESASVALELLLADESGRAESLASELDVQNRERQRIEKAMADEALASVRKRHRPDQDLVIVEGSQEWHIGVVGIVASRVLREFYRPTIILGGDGEYWRGSGRSIEGFDLAASLRSCSELLVRSGGHAMAAGVTMLPSNVEALRVRLNALARSGLTDEQLLPLVMLDGEVDFSELSLSNVDSLKCLEPIGQGNPAVRVCLKGIRVVKGPSWIGRDRQHLKFWVGTETSGMLESIWWNAPGEVPRDRPIDLACTPAVHEYQGHRYVQLKVLDWRECG